MRRIACAYGFESVLFCCCCSSPPLPPSLRVPLFLVQSLVALSRSVLHPAQALDYLLMLMSLHAVNSNQTFNRGRHFVSVYGHNCVKYFLIIDTTRDEETKQIVSTTIFDLTTLLTHGFTVKIAHFRYVSSVPERVRSNSHRRCFPTSSYSTFRLNLL